MYDPGSYCRRTMDPSLPMIPLKASLKVILCHVFAPVLITSLVLWGSQGPPGAAASTSLSESVAEAQCRASCLLKFTHNSDWRDETCRKNSDCYMCWNICRLLQGDSPARSSLCSDRAACFPGCQTACKFYEFLPSRNLTPPLLNTLPPLPAYMSPPLLTSDSQLLWERPIWPEGASVPSEDDVIMYIIMTKIGGIWHQHIQTSSSHIKISKKLKTSPLRVLAVTSAGLVAFSELTQNATASSHSLETKLLMKGKNELPNVKAEHNENVVPKIVFSAQENEMLHRKENGEFEGNPKRDAYDSNVNKYILDYDETYSESQPPSVTIDHSWNVNLTMKAIDLLVSVKVIWESRGSGEVDYMVTWTEATGGISGHLVSRQNTAEISLWKGQQYVVQVELLDHHGNSVLRSVPKSISFLPNNSSTPRIHFPRMHQTISTTPRSTTEGFLVAKIVKEDFDIHKEEDYDTFNPQVYSHNASDWKGDQPRNTNVAESENATSLRHWNEVFRRENLFRSNSRKVEETEDTDPQESNNSLLIWAVCLGVGAVIIIILIVMALRTMKRKGTKRHEEDFSHTEDYLSETTASSVNSSTTTSHLTRSQCSRPDEDRWNYESVYGVADQTSPKVGFHRHIPQPHVGPPIPLQTPLQPNFHSSVSHIHHYDLHYHHHPNPFSSSTSSTLPSTVGIDNASMIENYILSLDPSPVVKRVGY